MKIALVLYMKALLVASLAASISGQPGTNPPCAICGCSFCPAGFVVGNPSGLIPIPPEFLSQAPPGSTQVPCALLDVAGASGQIPADLCNDALRLLPEFRQACACTALLPRPTMIRSLPPSDAPTKSFSPTGAPTVIRSLAPSGAPTIRSRKCAIVNVLMDESFSMDRLSRDLVRTTMQRVSDVLRTQDYFVIVCNFGFADFADATTIQQRTRLQGCSVGYDDNDFVYNSTGTMEDGWEAIVFADNTFEALRKVDNIPLNRCSGLNKLMVLVTDEDRDDDSSSSLAFESVAATLEDGYWQFVAVVNQLFNPLTTVGVSSNVEDTTLTSYIPNGNGDFSTTISSNPFRSSFGTTFQDYTALLESVSGSVWNINKLRTGGDNAQALRAAFEFDILQRLSRRSV